MSYVVREAFYTLQGEGLNAGRAAVFLRFSGCNLWNGHPGGRHKGKGACAAWCDTDFAKGERMDEEQVLAALARLADGGLVVISGGEPCLQLTPELVEAMHGDGWEVAVETNGTIDNPALALCDHVTVSPKLGADLRVWRGAELKVVLPGIAARGDRPQDEGFHDCGWTEGDLLRMAKRGTWGALYVQPMDPSYSDEVGDTYLHGDGALRSRHLGLTYERNVQRCVDFVKANPRWRLSTQTHKAVGIP